MQEEQFIGVIMNPQIYYLKTYYGNKATNYGVNYGCLSQILKIITEKQYKALNPNR